MKLSIEAELLYNFAKDTQADRRHRPNRKRPRRIRYRIPHIRRAIPDDNQGIQGLLIAR
jgi:hypothetical protein